ncbi:MAG: hypothetical protein AB9844_04455 [Clostridiaceae bacterium]
MILVNEKVEHISYGFGVVTEVADNKISVKFQENIGGKIFQYPDAFEKFIKALNPAVESSVLEDLHAKQELHKLERLHREREDAKLTFKRRMASRVSNKRLKHS